ncbi:MAG: cyclomaltodextrinase [Lachnospiraceae bacterium]|nr:cyclomaltodextrinase [Lachnospiraceae bacterium]
MWAFENTIYQIYPLGFCGAPFENDGVPSDRIKKVTAWIPHLKKMGIGAVLFNPLFESDTHGYNTRDFRKVDTRLGSNEDFKEVCNALHEAGIKVILDGVFNHVGRGFYGFKDVQEKKWDSEYKDWFYINFDGNSAYNDGFWYEGWEGHFDLVKLNLSNEAVVNYLFDSVKMWVEEFGIDGLRLDVAYCIDRNFLRRLKGFTSSLKEDFFLVGEMIHGDYNALVADDMCDSATNYECYKGMHSAFNSYNLFEIVHSLLRQFGPEQWTLYKGKHLLSFVDNHDVSRIASILNNPAHIPLIYGMMFGMPGIPCIYYGSEWGAKGNKSDGDPALRPCFDSPEWNELTDKISSMIKARQNEHALCYGGFKSLVLTNRACVYERESENGRIMVAINADENPYTAHFDARAGRAKDLITGADIDFGGGLDIPPYTVYFLKPY